MFSRFFIDRPIFASVLSIILVLAGAVAVFNLPVAQYPEITPPTVEVSASYPGANAKVVAARVAAPLEQQINGVEGMMYMSSQCTNDGNYTLTITFSHSTDLNIAQVLVQNRVALAQQTLPDLVKRRGVAVKKKSPSVLMIINLFSPDKTRDAVYLSNNATIQLKDELSRLEGVGDITYLGQRDYSMRLWLDPKLLASLKISVDDVTRAVEAQNDQVAAGQIGQPPTAPGQAYQLTLSTMGRLIDVEQFGNIIVKSDPEGRKVKLREIARIELGAQSYDQSCTLDGQPSVALSVYQLPGSNALRTADRVRAKMEELKKRFPTGVDYRIVYDTTPFIDESINEVYKTLLDAIILVAAVVLLFLRNWRSALIPLVAVPVAIVGTFAVMAMMGFSLNNLTLFGLVLAIGIVVDDAIVVVEAVEHHIEHGLSPLDATIKAMEQVSGPVIAVGLVLSAVFVPCAFIGGITGQFFRQFALTIAVSTLISAFNSLTLSPALCALLLKPRAEQRLAPPLPRLLYPLLCGAAAWLILAPLLAPLLEPLLPDETPAWFTGLVAAAAGILVGWFTRHALSYGLTQLIHVFNNGFQRATEGYAWTVSRLLRISLIVLLAYGGLLYVTYESFNATPKGFIPQQDKGYLLVNLKLDDARAVGRTRAAVKTMEEVALRTPGVKHTVALAGQSLVLNANAPNFGSMYVMLDDFGDRRDPDLSSAAIAARLQTELTKAVTDGTVHIFDAPPVEGLGTTGGFKIVLEARGDIAPSVMQKVGEDVADAGNSTDELEGLFSNFEADVPWLFLDIDRVKAKSLGVSLDEVFRHLHVYFGSYYINDFNRFGRTWQVIAQADSRARDNLDRLKEIKIRSDRNYMVSIGQLIEEKWTSGPALIARYNLYPAVAVTGAAKPGISSGQAIEKLEEVAHKELPWAMRAEWTELAYLQQETGHTAMIVFALAVVLVFLVLAAQYESWSLPLAVILVVPMCLLCSAVGVLIAGLDVNIFTQVGFVVLIGLACKNAILIVEFARTRREAGVERHQATLEACRLRLRPIIMTSLAFILGVVPLVLAEGAGAEMRQTLGTAVFAGMIGVTLFGIFLTPVFFNVIQWVIDRQSKPDPDEP